MRKIYLMLLAVCCAAVVNGQITVTVTGNTNTTPNLAASYASLALALTDLNNVSAMSGPVSFALSGSETAPATGFTIGSASLNPVLSATNTLTFTGPATINAGVGTASPASAAPDGMLKLSGADYVTISNITFTDGNTTNPATMEFGVALFKRAAGDGCNFNTIQNCSFNMRSVNTTAGTAPMMDGSVAILVINSTAAAATTALTPTNGGTLATNGTNSNNKFYTNTINNGNNGIGLIGFAASAGVGPSPDPTTFLGDLNNDVGGVAAGTGNTITGYGGGASPTAAAGIRANNQWSINMSYNTMTSGFHGTTLRGIYAQAGTSAAANINNNSITVRSVATTSDCRAIDNGIGATAVSGNTVNMNNNTIRFSYTSATTGVFIGINNGASAGVVNINGNNIQQISATNYPSTGTINVIVGGSPGGPLNITNNTISNFVMTGASGTLRAITSSTPTGLSTITGNTIENLSYTTAASTGSITGIYNLASASQQNVNNNIIRNFSTPSTGTLNGIQNNTVAGTFQCQNNQIYNFSTTSGGAGGFSANGITWSNANVTITGNIIYSINSTGTTGGTGGAINGITFSGAATVSNNAIYDLSSNSTNVVITGITVGATGTNTVTNNLVGDLRAPNSTGNVAISGILVSSGTTNNIYHNTVNIAAATASATTFGTSAIYFSSSTPVNNLRNNIFVNTSAPGPTGGFTAAIRYTAAPTSTNFPATNNNNLYYAGTPAANRVIYCENGTATPANGQQTIGAYKTYINTTLPVAGREAASVSEAPNWASTTGSNPVTNFLQYNTGVATQIEQGGSIGTGIATDFGGTTRCPGGGCPGGATTPDIGAWELNGIISDINAPVISYTPISAPDCSTGDRLLNGVTIIDLSGVPTSGSLQPRVYYRKNGGTWFSSQGTLASGSGTNGSWNFTIVAADMGGLAGGDQIQYYVIAQDIASPVNIASNPAGAVATDVNTVSSAPASPNIVYVSQNLGGTYTVGSGGNFPNLTVAIAQYNATCGLTAPVIFDLLDASYSAGETFPLQINSATGASSVNTLTIRPTQLNTVISGANGTSIFTFNGAQYVTIDGRIGSTGSTRSLTITNTNNAAPAIVFINDATGGGVKYSDVKSDNTSTTSGVILFSTTTGPNGNDNITIDNCNIGPNAANPVNGIYSAGTTTSTTTYNSGNMISNSNIFDNFSATSDCNGILLSTGNDAWTIQGNSFYQTASRTFTTLGSVYAAIQTSSSTGNGHLISGNYIGGSAALCAGTPMTFLGNGVLRGLRLTVGTTTATSIQGNTIQNISITSSSTSTSQSAMSLITGSFNCGTVSGNIIGSPLANATTSPSIDISISGSAAIFTALLAGTGTPGALNISNNSIGGIRVVNTGAPATGTSVRGIGIQGAVTSLTLSNNTVGSTSQATNFVSAANSSLLGIFLTTTNAGSVISNNTVANLSQTSSGTSAGVVGIQLQGSSGGSYATTGNTVRTLRAASTSTSNSVTGIVHIAATTAGQSVSQNTVYDLLNTDATAATGATGIIYSGPTSGSNTVARNLVYDVATSSTSATSFASGITFGGGLAIVQNNMVRMGANVANGNLVYGIYENGITAGSGIYFNSVYMGGTGTGSGAGNTYAFFGNTTTNARTIQNNIFMNARSNGATTGKHYAVFVNGSTPNPAGLSLNYNDYFVSGTGGVFGQFNGSDVTGLGAWQTAVGQDAVSLNVDPLFIAATASTPDLHITSGTTVLESAALSVAGITDDYDAQVRPGAPSGSNSGLGPDIGADEFDGINPNICSGTPSQGGTASASTLTTCIGSNVTFTLNAPFTTGPGITYQWQTSPAGAGTWSNVSGATAIVASFPITGNTDVRCLVTCTPSGLSTPSTTVTVNSFECQFNVTRTTGITYSSIAGTGTSMSGWRNTNSTDDNLSTSQPIGFSFPYKGVNYSNFSVSTNGFLTFNVGTSATGSGSTAYGWQNTQFTSTTGTLNALAPFYEDLVCQGNPGTAAGLASSIKYQMDGTTPNRVLTVEWIGMETFSNAGPNLNFQVKLYETSGQIQYVYGTMEGYNGTSNYGYSYTMGLNAPTISGTPTTIELQTQQVENVQNFSNVAKNDLGRTPECNTVYTFIPATYGGAGASPGIPANDDPAGALTLPVNGTPCSTICGTIYTSFQATASSGITVCGAVTPGTPDDDVWFKFTATTAQQTITVKGGGGYDAVVQLFSDAGITSLSCVNAAATGLTETFNANGLTPGNVYYVRVYHAGTGSSQAPGSGTTTAAAGNPDFSICVNEVIPPPANDDPCGAYNLTVGATCAPYSDNALPSRTSFITATNTTSNGVTTPACTGAGTVNDVWFSFTAPTSGVANVNVTPVSGVNPAVELFSASGTCPGLTLTSVQCTNASSTGGAETPVYSGLTPGSTYYLRVYQHPSGTGGAPVSNSQFSICVYAPLPSCPATFTPANAANVCASASPTVLSWTAGTDATGYDVYFDAGAGPATTLVSPNQAGLTYSAGVLAAGQYAWRIEAKNANGTVACSNLTFTVVAGPTVSATPAGPISICSPATQLLTGSSGAASPTYQWQNNGSNISGATNSTYTASTSGNYTLIVTDGVTGCSATSNAVSVTVNAPPSAVTITPSSASVCANGPAVQLTASGGAINITGSPVASSGTSGLNGNPYRTFWDGGKLQFIYTAAELSAAGLVAGTPITSLGFDVTVVGNPLPNFTIEMKHTTASTFASTTMETGMTTVFSTASPYQPVSGVNTHTFSTPFIWNGTDNILFSTCFGTSLTSSSSQVRTVPDVTSTVLQSATDLTTCATATGSTNATRPFIILSAQTSVNFTWTPNGAGNGLYTDAGASNLYTGGPATQVFALPGSTTTYTATATTPAGCTSSNTVTVTVNPTPAIPTLVANPSGPICAGTSVTFTASNGSQYEFFVDAVSQGAASSNNTFTTSTLTNGQVVTVRSYSPFAFNGTIEPSWGSPLATQAGGPVPGFGAGHEINAIYTQADANNINIAVAGNVQNGNRILVFIDSKSGGYNNGNFGRDNAPQGADDFNSGTSFDAGFEADYVLAIGTNVAGDNNFFDLYTLSGTAGSGGGPNTYLGDRFTSFAGAVTGANPANSDNTRGFEVAIPKSLLGYAGGTFKIMAMYTSDAGFLSNQFLTRANNGEGNYGSGSVNFGTATPDPITVAAGNLSNTCSSTSSGITMTVNPLPTASITGNNSPVCTGGDATFNLSGTANATVTYNINGGGNQPVTLNGAGSATVTITGVSANQTMNLVSVTNGTCSQTLSGSSTVTVAPCTPPNDDAPGAIDVTVGAGCTGAPYTNVGATQSVSEPFAACLGTAGYKTVWYKFTAPASGNVRITNDFSGGTLGSDTRLALFSTSDVNNYGVFTPIACDDDNGTTVADRSVLYATGLTPGTTYYIQVDGKTAGTTTGTFCLAVDELSTTMLSSATACAPGQDLVGVNDNYTGWLSATDASGKLIAMVRNPSGGATTSTYTVSQNINGAAVRTDAVSGQKYLDRNYLINNNTVTNANIRFFFLNSELSALQAADPGVTLANLQVARQTGTTCQADFVAANGSNSLINQSGNGTGTGFSWIQATTPGFSNFYLYSSKSFVPVKVFLHGAYSTGLTRHKDVSATWAAVLNANALSQPYSGAPFNYSGTESVSAGFFTSGGATTDVTDWVLVELRDKNNPATLITRRAAFVREDGRIVDLDGVSNLSFRNLATDNYFVVIRHRNHLGIRASSQTSLDGTLGVATPALYDFSTGQSQAFQDGAITANGAMRDMGTGVFGMWGGNGNANNTVRANGSLALNDYLFLVTSTLGGNVNLILTNTYSRADYNMDGTVRASGSLAINDYLFLTTTTLGGDLNKIVTQHQ